MKRKVARQRSYVFRVLKHNLKKYEKYGEPFHFSLGNLDNFSLFSPPPSAAPLVNNKPLSVSLNPEIRTNIILLFQIFEYRDRSPRAKENLTRSDLDRNITTHRIRNMSRPPTRINIAPIEIPIPIRVFRCEGKKKKRRREIDFKGNFSSVDGSNVKGINK